MKYQQLNQQEFSNGEFKLIPIRFEDRYKIMQWRNEQMYHLRQAEPLTKEKQDAYFKNVVAKLFNQDQPDQILFSYLENDKCIGYGGLVHINWIDENAEISFIMATELEEEHFHFHWKTYLELIEQVAFKDLGLHKVYTYAFDIRPHLYEAIEALKFKKEAVFVNHSRFGNKFVDVVIHSKFNPYFLREIIQEDVKVIYNWVNDSTTRQNSFNSNEINFEDHINWFKSRLNNPNSDYYMCYYKEIKSGIIRFDIEDNTSTIGINISPKQRGKGLSSVFLNLSIKSHLKKHSNQTILAYIKPENEASIRTFKKAGFSFFTEKEVNNKAALLFKY
ncbi:GNAT family N-acetyltransferase [Psychroflexus sp. MBR-150]|jgi:RimJ/RimL family protein N-acetyltransferase